MSKTAVIFPGIGYHCDRPLLYFSAKLAMAAGYEIIKIEYPFCAVDLLKAERSQLRAFSESCVSAALDQLKEKGFSAEGETLFISKSIGTAIAAACGAALPGKIRHIYFTPLEDTFEYMAEGSGIAFCGTKDGWADSGIVARLCKEKKIPLTGIEGANHSLETGDVCADIETLKKIMTEVEAFIRADA